MFEGSSARNRLRGIVTAVVKDTVMAQVDLQAGPFRIVVADEPGGGRRPRAGGRLGGGRGHQIHDGRGGTVHIGRSYQEEDWHVRTRGILAAFAAIALLATAGCGDDSGDGAAGAPQTSAGAGVTGDDQRLRRGVADRRRSRRSARTSRRPTRAPRSPSTSPAARRWPPRSTRAPRPTCSPPPRPATMKAVTDAGNGDGTPVDLRQEPARHRRAQGQPEGHHGAGRPDQARREGRAVRRAGALRRGREEGARRRRA